MNCQESQERLSAYHDGELPAELQDQVTAHLEQCAQCAATRDTFVAISEFVSSCDVPSSNMLPWSQLDHLLEETDTSHSPTVTQPKRFSARRWLTIAALLLLVVGVSYGVNHGWHTHTGHDHFTAEFGHYLDEFGKNPEAAQQFLLTNYENRRVPLNDAVHHVGYRPLAANGLPSGYTAESTFVMTMPCCTCVQTLCKRNDGTMVAIFEHDDDAAPLWFGDRADITATCAGKECCLVEIDDRIAATWKQGSRYVTLIGVRDVEEVQSFVTSLNES